MAIPSLLPPKSRMGVACIGELPSGLGDATFEDFGFQTSLHKRTDLAVPSSLQGIAAVVFSQGGKKPRLTDFLEIVELLLNCDCQVFVRVRDEFRKMLVDAIRHRQLPAAGADFGKEMPPPPYIYLVGAGPGSWKEVLRQIVVSHVGHRPNLNLNIPQDDQFCPDEKLLLQRAFWDCRELHWISEDGGKSKASVFQAYVEYEDGHVASHWPLPRFVKIGPREEVFSEFKVYDQMVNRYVPFHLGPNLDRERCCLGASKGILVGDYIEESEPLDGCARNGRASAAISCLFNRTLQGWHRGATRESARLSEKLSFPSFNKNGIDSRLELAKRLGAQKRPSELQSQFLACSGKVGDVIIGPTHGDLHAKNILVRATDAVVIDFLENGERPVVYDAACLEASLLVDGFNESPDQREETAWLDSVATLYDNIPLTEIAKPPHPKNPIYWFYGCVRQVRLYAKPFEATIGQYEIALAIALLNKASKDTNADGAEHFRRAAAYLIAEKILDLLGKRDG